jgi:thiosulfate dehydrogenase [quinone] large subunit
VAPLAVVAAAPARNRAGPRGAALVPAWILVPLRLFLGFTFLYAGVQKLTDPQFFRPAARGYIGHQIQAFAHGSPIGWLLLHVALPHAVFFGALIAWGEIAIGLGTLVGLLARPAAAFGLLLSLIFFLSASWRVYPYFYGADIVFAFAWLTLWLAPHAGLPSLDAELTRLLEERGELRTPERRRLAWLALAVTGASSGTVAGVASSAPAPPARAPGRHAGRRGRQREETRRGFLLGVGGGLLGALGLVWLWDALHASSGGAGAAGGSSQAGSAPGTTSGGVVARASDIAVDASATFTVPGTGDPGVIVHLPNGRFVAYDATCTHAGCPVQYDPSSGALICPCHGAAFDPANQAAVLQGPAPTPLAPVAITVGSNGDIVVAG